MPTQEPPVLRPEQLLGIWHLRACKGHNADGEMLYLYGTAPVGMLMYDPQGYMMDTQRPWFTSDDRAQVTPDELKAAFAGFNAYCGTYTLDPIAGTVTHHVLASQIPNAVGTDQVRYIALADGQLQLSSPPILVRGTLWTFHLTWQRAP